MINIIFTSLVLKKPFVIRNLKKYFLVIIYTSFIMSELNSVFKLPYALRPERYES